MKKLFLVFMMSLMTVNAFAQFKVITSDGRVANAPYIYTAIDSAGNLIIKDNFLSEYDAIIVSPRAAKEMTDGNFSTKDLKDLVDDSNNSKYTFKAELKCLTIEGSREIQTCSFVQDLRASQ